MSKKRRSDQFQQDDASDHPSSSIATPEPQPKRIKRSASLSQQQSDTQLTRVHLSESESSDAGDQVEYEDHVNGRDASPEQSATQRTRIYLSESEEEEEDSRETGIDEGQEDQYEEEEEEDEEEQDRDEDQGQGRSGRNSRGALLNGSNLQLDQDQLASHSEALSDEEADEEDEQQQELERIEAEREQARSRPSAVAEAGIVDKVELFNFMCHKRLTMSMGPQLNFVIGHNGSGKSAILTGITIALGGKASATSRATSLKSFVKEGCSAAEIVVQLKNEGVEAYKPEVYGTKILIERRINADGGGSWKIKNDQGKTVSTTRAELDAICDHNNIQVDNPMNILTQDAARQFLSGSKPAETYKFFLDGTQLSQLAREYDIIKENLKKMQAVISKKSGAIEHMQRQADDANQRWHLVKAARSFANKIDELKNEMVWAQIIQKEKDMRDGVMRTIQAKEKLDATKLKYQEAEDNLRELENKIGELEERTNDRNDRQAPLKARRDELKRLIKDKTAAYRNIVAEEKALNEQYERIEATKQNLQDQIDAEADKMADDGRARREELERQRDDLQSQRKTLEDEDVELKYELNSLIAQLKDNSAKIDESEKQRERLQLKAAEIDKNLSRYRSSGKDRLMAFGGPAVPALCAAIESETGWRKKPIGPIGMHIRLKDKKWASVLETVLSNHLNAFCVTNHADRQRLTTLMRRHRCNSSIITCSEEPFDYSEGEPDPDVLTILRALDIEDDYITRQLITAANIERSALVEERRDGDMLMRSGRKNIQCCYSQDLYKITGGAIGSSTQTLRRRQGPPRFTTDYSEVIKETERALREVEDKIRAADVAIRALKTESTGWEKRVKEIKRALPNVVQSIRKKIEEIARVEEDMHEDEPANVAALEEAKKESEEELEKLRQKFQEIQERKKGVIEERKPLEVEMDELKRQLDTFDEAREGLRQELEKTTQARVKQMASKTHWEPRIKVLEDELRAAEREEAELEQEVEEWTAQAQEYCDRVETERSAEYLEKEIDRLEEAMKRADRECGVSLEVAAQEVQTKNKAVADARADFDHTKACRDLMHKSLKARLAKWHLFRRFIALRAKSNFTYNLSNRGYTGELNFNHDSQRLSLSVQTEDTRHGQRKKDPRSLSGGEKSFSTICMLLSLWQAIGCPIRCLDEFDVFMDAVNRKIALKMIIDETKTSQNVQYILITPQNMANTPMGPEVRVHRMKDPERAQGVLS
ncbi:P-loop containing nucleoside triphosphate hydrolase protein [Violaceomyces palustris]|uniref:P-loop containing nucleoside triphosphate hydrolase protein n=1 Tax=Violaceomyces palustris TaxID=1673888 RepID=A0ACD0NTP6_9BASI|nr:P-loop containing nucleoside triphosphate hydrolase protein [Violaceomyces palustris]